MLPEVPQTRPRPAVRKELSLKSAPQTHSCAAQLSGGVQGVRDQQALAAVRRASLSWVPAWPMRHQEPLIHALNPDNTLANAMIDTLTPLIR